MHLDSRTTRTPAGARAPGILEPPAGTSVSRYLRSMLYNKKVGPLVGEFAYHRGHPPRTRVVQENLEFVRARYLPYLERDVLRVVTPRLADYGRVREALANLAAPRNRPPPPRRGGEGQGHLRQV